MSIERLRLFAEVVKQGNFSKAASYLSVSKGYLSIQVKQLEQELNKQLLIRNTRTMRLTSAGEVVFKQAVELTHVWEHTKQALTVNEDRPSGLIKCTAPVGLSKYVLWPVFQNILNEYEDIEFAIDSGNKTHNLVSVDFDFAVRITNTPPEDMVAKKLFESHYVCCASPAFIHRFGQPEHPSSLINFHCLILAHWPFWIFHRSGDVEKVNLSGKLVATDNDLLKQAALDHMGIVRLPEYMIREELLSGELVRILPDYNSESRHLYLLYPQMSNRALRVKLVIERLISQFNG